MRLTFHTMRKEFLKNSKALNQDIIKAKKDLSRRAKKDPKLIYSYIISKMEVKEEIMLLKGADGSLKIKSNGMAELINSRFKLVSHSVHYKIQEKNRKNIELKAS